MAEAAPTLRRDIARRALVGSLGLALSWLIWLPAGDAFVKVFCATGNAILEPLTLGKGGHIQLQFAAQHAAAAGSADAADSWNARLWLRIDNVPKEHAVRVNPRRLAYLPLALLLALAAALPLSWRQRAWIVGAGVPVLFAGALASIWITAVWFFGQVPGLVYDLSPFQQSALHFLYEGLVTPLGNRLIVPFFLVAPALWAPAQRNLGSFQPPRGKSASARKRAVRGTG